MVLPDPPLPRNVTNLVDFPSLASLPEAAGGGVAEATVTVEARKFLPCSGDGEGKGQVGFAVKGKEAKATAISEGRFWQEVNEVVTATPILGRQVDMDSPWSGYAEFPSIYLSSPSIFILYRNTPRSFSFFFCNLLRLVLGITNQKHIKSLIIK